ncbi:MAG: HDOD domain-containing protein, partial [Candidatus Zixiibacteriota bacterium]
MDYQTVIESQLSLPSVPAVVHQLNSLISKKDVNSRELANIVETDQGFTARIIKLVNSPFYGFARQITSVEEAITMLGLDALHQLLLATSVMSTLRADNSVLNANDFWLHSFGVGVLAKHLLYKQNKELAGEAFLCGVLHDIGRLVFIKMDQYKFLGFYNEGKVVTDLEKETEWFGIDHQKLGELLAKKWNFPDSFTVAIANHHTPESVDNHTFLVSAVSIADLICHGMNIGNSGNNYVSTFSPQG